MHGNMSIQNRNIVQIAVICNTLGPFHLAPDLFWLVAAGARLVSLISSDVIIPRSLATGQGGGVSSLSLPYTPAITTDTGAASPVTTSQHLLISYIPSVTRRLVHSR